MITENDLRWLAGALESKGRLDHRVRYGRKQLFISFNSQDIRVAQEISLMCGLGRIYKTGGSVGDSWDKKACSEHCPESHVHVMRGSETFKVYFGGNRAEIVLWNLLPFLRVKKEEWGGMFTGDYPETENGPSLGLKRSMAREGWALPDFLSAGKLSQIKTGNGRFV